MTLTHRKKLLVAGVALAVPLVFGLTRIDRATALTWFAEIGRLSDFCANLPWRSCSDTGTWPERLNPTWRESN
jgi:hypothetical protein